MKKVALMLVLIISSASFADTKWCGGTIKNIYIDYNGDVFINGSWRNQHTRICNVASELDGVPVDTCKSWVSYVQVAYVAQKNVTLHYNDIDSCESIPSYTSAPRPTYVMLK
jgi:hypothetical protein